MPERCIKATSLELQEKTCQGGAAKRDIWRYIRKVAREAHQIKSPGGTGDKLPERHSKARRLEVHEKSCQKGASKQVAWRCRIKVTRKVQQSMTPEGA